MKIEEIQALAEIDTKVDKSEIDNISVRLPSILNKWHKIYFEEALVLKKLDNEKKSMYKKKWLYYLGKAEPEEYVKEPFELRIIKTDLETFLEADKSIQEANSKYELQKQKLKYIESVVSTLNNMNWTIRNAIEFMKFMNGGPS